MNVSMSIPHEDFGERLLLDIALLLLKKPLKFTKLIQPIQLLTKEVKRLENITICGWGRVWTNGPLSDSLKFNFAFVLSADECKRSMKVAFPGQICLAHSLRTGNCFVSFNTFFSIILVPVLGRLWWFCNLRRKITWSNKLWRR